MILSRLGFVLRQNSATKSARLTLEILATSDVHGVILPTKKDGSGGSLSQISTLVTERRAQGENILLLDNGDYLQGSELCEFVAEASKQTSMYHPIMQVMNHMQYDAIGLGNHEFDYGLAYLRHTLAQAEFPVLGSNISTAHKNWMPHCILKRKFRDEHGTLHPIRIGLLSLLPEQVTAWNARYLNKIVQTQDIVETASQVSALLRSNGADIVVCLLHSGIGEAGYAPRLENAAIPVAKHADIDALICGHTHRMLPDHEQTSTSEVNFNRGEIHGVPAVMPGFNADYIGQIKLELCKGWNGFKVTGHSSRLLPVSGIDVDPTIEDLVYPTTQKCAASLSSKVGHTDIPLHSYFSRLPGDPAVALSAQAQLDYAKKHLAAILPVGVPVISAASPFKGGGRGGPDNFVSIPAGTITKRDLNRLHPFQNTLVALQMTGAELIDWLEMSASSFNQIASSDQVQPLRNPEFPCYGFDTVFGVSYEIDPRQPARFDPLGHQIAESNRVKKLRYNGKPVSERQQFIMLTNSYRAGGGGNFPVGADMKQLEIPVMDSRKILRDFVNLGVSQDRLPNSPWRFTPALNQELTADIGPGVLPLLAENYSPEVPISVLKCRPDGFLECSVELGAEQPLLACNP